MVNFFLCVVLISAGNSKSAEAFSFETEIRQVSYLSWQQPRFSTQNPDNNFLGLTRY